MARLYTVTGEARYREYFTEILDIRNGIEARPAGYFDLPYWDIVLDTGERPGAAGQPVAIRTLAKNAGLSPAELAVTGATYLKGLTEAATEMRRFALDLIRQDRVEEADPYLEMMDEIYSLLVTVDFPDAVTGGLRRQTDVLRGVLERTRGDLTTAMRQEKMQAALRRVEERLG